MTYGFVTGWNHRLFSKAEMTNVGADSWDDPMVRMKLVIIPKVGEDVSVSFDNYQYGLVGLPKIIMSFDDGHDSNLTNAFPIMNGNNQLGTEFVVPSWIGNPNRLTLANMITLRDAGWDISNHTMTHQDLTTRTPEQLETEINDAYRWLGDNGFGLSKKLLSYPFSAFNDSVIAKVKQYHDFARAGHRPFAGYHVRNGCPYDFQYFIHIIPFTAARSAAQITADIDHVIERGGMGVLLMHDVVAAGPSADGCLTADFLTVSNYLKAKQDAGSLEVIKLSDYYAALPS